MDSHGEKMEESLGDLFFRCLNKNGNKPAQFIVDTNETDTHKQLLQRSIRAAIKLRQKNIKPGDVIGICTTNHENSCVPMIAAQFLGAINSNFDFNVSPAIMVHLLRLVEPKIMFVDPGSAAGMAECVKSAGIVCEVVVFDSDKGGSGGFGEYLKPSDEEEGFLHYKVKNVKDTAMILFSSGTTGYPKGICLNHHALKGQILYDRFYNLSCTKPGLQTVFLLYTRLYWISSVGSVIKSILYGCARVICDKFDPVQAWDIIAKYKVTTMFMTPHLGVEFVASRPIVTNTESLSVVYIGGAKMPQNLMAQLYDALPNSKILQIYGNTESSGVVATLSATDPIESELQRKYHKSFGKFYDFIQWKIVDAQTEEKLDVNQQGELRFKHDYLMNCYHKMDSTKEFDREGFLKSGDVVHCNEDGCMFMVGRIKEMFKYRAQHIVPSVLEDVVLLHRAVKEAVIIGIPHDVDEHHPMAVVILKEGQSVSPEEIERFYAGKVFEAQKLRAGVKIVQELPRTSTGKVMRNVVQAKILSGEL